MVKAEVWCESYVSDDFTRVVPKKRVWVGELGCVPHVGEQLVLFDGVFDVSSVWHVLDTGLVELHVGPDCLEELEEV